MRRGARRVLIVLAATALAAAVWAYAEAGRYLQHEEPLRHADAIFVLAGMQLERALEAADLYREDYAPLILLSPGLDEPAVSLVRQKGIYFPRSVDLVADVLVRLGIPRESVIIGQDAVDNTAAEAKMLRGITTSRGWRTVIVVTSKYHTRRAGFAMRRGLDGTGAEVVMRASRYDQSDPARWWRYRRDVRFLIDEWPKLIAYRLGLRE